MRCRMAPPRRAALPLQCAAVCHDVILLPMHLEMTVQSFPTPRRSQHEQSRSILSDIASNVVRCVGALRTQTTGHIGAMRHYLGTPFASDE